MRHALPVHLIQLPGKRERRRESETKEGVDRGKKKKSAFRKKKPLRRIIPNFWLAGRGEKRTGKAPNRARAADCRKKKKGQGKVGNARVGTSKQAGGMRARSAFCMVRQHGGRVVIGRLFLPDGVSWCPVARNGHAQFLIIGPGMRECGLITLRHLNKTRVLPNGRSRLTALPAAQKAKRQKQNKKKLKKKKLKQKQKQKQAATPFAEPRERKRAREKESRRARE